MRTISSRTLAFKFTVALKTSFCGFKKEAYGESELLSSVVPVIKEFEGNLNHAEKIFISCFMESKLEKSRLCEKTPQWRCTNLIADIY